MVRSHKPTKSSHAFDLLCCRLGIERWRRVVYKGILYPDYDVSNMGHIRYWYRPRERVLSQTKNAKQQRESKPPFLGRYGKSTSGSRGKGVYMRAILSWQRKRQHADVHRLVAEAFIPNDENKPTVDHWKSDDVNKTNNRLDNLSWATRKEQAANRRPRTHIYKWQRPVWKLDKTTGERLERYDSLSKACKAVGGACASTMREACTGKYRAGRVLRTYKGFKWVYDNDDVNAHEDETWTRIEPDVLDTKNTYDCSTYGRVRRVKGRETIIVNGADQIRGTVYFHFVLKNGRTRSILNNVLTAKVFISNPDNLPQVNHIDGDPSNCHVSNLEWTTGSGNLNHAYAKGLCKHAGWTTEEDQSVLDLIARYPGRIPWSKHKLPGRSTRSLSRRAIMLRKRGLKNRTDM